MTLYSSTLLFTAITSLVLGCFVWLKGRDKLPNITLALFTLAVVVWTGGQFMGELAGDKTTALLWTRFNSAGAIFIPVFFLHFVLAFLDKINVRRSLISLTYAVGGIFLALDFTPFFIADVVPKLSFKFYPVPGIAYLSFIAMLFILIVYGFYELFRGALESSGSRRNHIVYVLGAGVIGFAGGLTSLFPLFGLNLFPFGYYFLPLYVLIAVYAILKHRLLDIVVIIRKGLVYSTLIGLFTGIYILLILSLGNIFQTVTGFNSLLATALTVVAFAALFQPLRDKVQIAVDNLFFKGKYDYQKTLKKLSQAAISIISTDELLHRVISTVTEALKIEKASIWLLDKETEEYVIKECLGFKPPDLGFPDEDPLIDLLKWDRTPILVEELPPELTRVKEELKKLQASICIPILSKDRLIGLLNLGSKLSGDMFTDEDLGLLTTLCNQVGVALENARLYEEIMAAQRQLYQADKLAALGTIAAGAAHEIKNPLAAVKGLSQVLPENIEDKEFVEKFRDIVPRQLDRIDGIVNNLLKFGRPSKLQISPVKVNDILESILRLVESQCRKKNIRILKDFKELPALKADSEQLTQAFINIILNALQAMPQGGDLKIRTEGAEINGKIKTHVEISDTGVGIVPERLKNIFDPFYSTKDDGVGLGLSITYRIIKEHRGSIEVKSEIREGTTFSIYV